MKRSATRLPVAASSPFGGDPFDLAAEYATLGIEFVDREADTARVVLTAVAVLAARVAGQPELDRLLLALRVHVRVPPRPEESDRPASAAVIALPLSRLRRVVLNSDMAIPSFGLWSACSPAISRPRWS